MALSLISSKKTIVDRVVSFTFLLFLYGVILLCSQQKVMAQAGNLDSTFNYDGHAGVYFGIGNSRSEAIAVQSDGKIVIAGYYKNGTYYDFAIIRYKTNGDLDSTFGTNGKVLTSFFAEDDKAFGVIIQPDGKIIAVGYTYDTSNNHDVFAVARYNSNGSLDATFGGDGRVTTSFGTGTQHAYSVALQSDGKIVVCGKAEVSSLTSDIGFGIVRYTSTGMLDNTFAGDGRLYSTLGDAGYDSPAYDVAIQNNGSIVITGYVGTTEGTKIYVLRVTSTGNFDNTFDGNGLVNTLIGQGASAGKLVIQPDQKIVVAGTAIFSPLNAMAVVRYNTDGSLDSTFDADGIVTTQITTGNFNGRAIALQPDGKIVAAGGTQVGTDYDFGIVRFNTDGSLDNSFGTGGKITIPLASGTELPSDLKIQNDGKILVTGYTEGDYFKTVRLIGCSNSSSMQTAAECLSYFWFEDQQTYTNSGTYSVTYPNATGCDSVVSLDLTIYQLPNTNVTQNGVTLTAVQSGADYRWLDCNHNNDLIPGATSQSYTATENGSYRVEITKNGCTDFSNCYTINSIGIEEVQANRVIISPNPTSDRVTVSSDFFAEKIVLTDMSGRELLNIGTSNSQTISLDLSIFANGIYFIQLTDEKEQTTTAKLVKN